MLTNIYEDIDCAFMRKKFVPNTQFFADENLCQIINGNLAVAFPKDYMDMPIIMKQNIDLDDFKYIGFQNTRIWDDRNAETKTVGFFLKDEKFECVCRQPWKYVKRLSQYKQIMSPDVSCFTDMAIEEQWYNIFLNRLIGKYWQNCGLTVMPTITWSDTRSYGFSFAGIEEGCVVAVSTIGTQEYYDLFMSGFVEMCKSLRPAFVVCYCRPYQEMYQYAKIVSVEYEGRLPWLEAKHKPDPNQLTLFDCKNMKEVV